MNLDSLKLENKRISAPIQASTAVPKSICILVHGRGGKLELMRWFSKRLKVPGLDYVLVQAPHPEFVKEMKEPGFSWFLRPDAQGVDQSRIALKIFIEDLISEGYAEERIFWLGFSQGGIMGVDTALRGKHQLGGVICVSGFALNVGEYPQAFGSHALDQRLVATHGRRDTTVDFNFAKSSYSALEALGVSIEFREYNKPHSFELKKEIPEIEAQLIEWTAGA